MLILSTLTFLFFVSSYAQANTEIINFAITEDTSSALSTPWPYITSANRELSLNITPILDPVEASPGAGVWFNLDLDDTNWNTYDKFTLRASWPASHPCDIYLKIYDTQQTSDIFPKYATSTAPVKTRNKYAHVYVVNTGVPTPSPLYEDMTWLRLQPVPVVLILEPLHFGVLPHSVIPVIWMLVFTIILVSVITPYVSRYFGRIAAPFIDEVASGKRDE